MGVPQVVVFWRGLSSFVGFPKGQSVIEEKGEGFENGKKYVGSFGVPSTSVFPPKRIARLKILYSNKPCASQIKPNNNY
jgi:hypothetical protein